MKNKLQKKKCLMCKTKFEINLENKNSLKRKYCCPECYFKSKIGKKDSEETKNRKKEASKKRKDKYLTLEQRHGKEKADIIRKKQSLWQKGKNKSPGHCKNIGIGHTGLPHPNMGKTYEEIHGKEKALKLREVRSISRSNIIMKNKDVKGSKYKHGYFFSKINNKKMYYRSSYELEAYKLLDDEDAQSIIKSWKTEPFRISYFDGEIIRNHVPDILVKYKSGKRQIINVKPSSRMKEEVNIIKSQAAEKYCKENNMIHSIWTEKELGITKEKNRELLEIHEGLKNK